MINRLINLIPLFTVTTIQILRRIKQRFFIVLTVFLLSACGSDDSSEKETEVETGDGIGPVITVSGELEVDWPQGAIYRDMGATSYDEADDQYYYFLQGTDIDVSVVGTQTVTYTISDSENNESVATRTVNIYTPIPFITTWTTMESNQSITIPTDEHDYYDYDFSIDWGDGSATEVNQESDVTHIYAEAGTYTISIAGIFSYMPNTILFEDVDSDMDKLTSVEQWGSIKWDKMESMFQGTENLVINATDAPVLSNVESMSFMFSYAKGFNSDISHWDVSNVTDMSYMFSNATEFNQPLDNWDVSKVTNMSNMFSEATEFNQPLNTWDVSNVTDMKWMFEGASAFNQPLDSWDVSSVTNMYLMFGTNSFLLQTVFNQDLNNWDVSNVTNMSDMFSRAIHFNQPLDNWNVSNVKDMNNMFYGATEFNQPLDTWDVSNVTDMSDMFSYASEFNQPLNNWDVSKVTNMSNMLSFAEAFNQPLNAWDVSNVTDISFMFSYTDAFNQPLDNWDVSNVTTMSRMFFNADAFNQPLNAWDVSNVKDMKNMLYGSALSTDNYDDMLIAWSQLVLQSGVFLTTSVYYSDKGEAARQSIRDSYHWTFEDNGLQP